MTCLHMCAMLGKKEYFIPSMFHIRWHKIFNYYHRSEFGSSNASNLCYSLEETRKVTRQSCFRMSGYKRVYVLNTSFLKDLDPYDDLSTTRYDPVYELMLRIYKKK